MSERREQVKEIAREVKLRMDERLGEIWWFLLSRGVLTLVLALCALVWPQRTMEILIKILGVYFLIDAVVAAVWLYRSGDKGATLVQVITSLTIGLVLLIWTGVSAKLFMIFLGLWLLLQGIGLFLSSRKLDPSTGVRTNMAATGGIMALLGVVFVVWPDTGVVTVSWLIGLTAFALGCLLIFLATRIKRLQIRVDAIGEG